MPLPESTIVHTSPFRGFFYRSQRGNSGATTATSGISGYQIIETMKLHKIKRKSCIEVVKEQKILRWAAGIVAQKE